MRLYKAVLFFLMVSVAPLASSASLEKPFHLELLALNGKKQKDDSALDNLEVGKQQVVIRYVKDLKVGSKYDLYTSLPYVIELDVKSESDVFELNTKNFTSYNQAESAFDRDSVGWLLERNGKKEPIKVEQLELSGFMPIANIEKSIRAHNKEKGIVLTSSGTVNATEASIRVNEKTGEVEVSGDPVTQLKLWYTKASKDEQKEFRRWMIDQE